MRRMASRTPDLLVSLDGLRLAADIVMRQFVTGLRHAKPVGSQFGSVHSVKQIVFVWNGFACFDGVTPQAAV